MTSLRERIGRRLMRGELEKQEQAFGLMHKAYRRGPYILSPESLARQLTELDSRMVDLLVSQRGFDIIGGGGFGALQFTEADRLNVVDQTRRAYHTDVQCYRAVNAWTDFGFGTKVIVKPQDDALANVFDEFWTARRNRSLLKQSKLDDGSNKLVRDGEVFFAFYADAVGAVTVRRFTTEVIKSVVYETDADGNEDTDAPLFYVQDTGAGLVYWPDWAALKEQLEAVELPTGAKRADEMAQYTRARMQRVSYDDINGRGWPVVFRAVAWYAGYKEALWDWAAVAAKVAMFPTKIKHKAGSRGTTGLKAQIESSLAQSGYGSDTNPSPASGSTFIESEAAELIAMSRQTGAMEWQAGTLLLAGQMTAGDGVPLVYRGRPDTAQNRSVAEVSTVPWDQQTNRYAELWADTFREWVEIVGMFYEEHNTSTRFDTYAADVSVSRPTTLSTTTEDLVHSLDAVDQAVLNGTLDAQSGQAQAAALVAVLLERFGISVDENETGPTEAMPAVSVAIENLKAGTISEEEFVTYVTEVDSE